MTRGRFTALSLTAVALAAAAAYGLPKARAWGEEKLRRRMETEASRLFGGPVRVKSLRVEFVPPGIHLEAVQAEREGNRGSQALAGADEVSLRASLLTFLRLRSGPCLVRMKRPRIALHLAEGRSFSAGGPADSSSPEIPAVPAGSKLEVQDGRVEIDLAGGPALKLEGVQLEAGPQPEGRISGSARFAAGSYDGPGGIWKGLSGDVTFLAAGSEVTLDPLALRGDGLSVGGRLTVRGGDSAVYEGALDVGLDMEKLARLFPEGADPHGQLKASLTGSLRDGVPNATGAAEVEQCALWGVAIGTLRSDIALDQVLHLKGVRAHLLGGEATGTSEVRFGKEGFDATTDLRLDGVDAAQVLEHAGWTGPPLTGTIHYTGTHRIDSSGLASLRGEGVVDAVGHYRSPSGEDLPLEVTVEVAVTGQTVYLKDGSLRAGSTRASFSGRAAPSEGIALKMSGGTGNLPEILPLFAPPKKKAPLGPPRPAPSPTPPPKSARPAALRAPARPAAILLASWPPRPPRVSAVSAPAPHAARPRAAAAPGRPSASEPPGPLERIIHSLGGRWEWDGDLSYGRGGLNFSGRLAGADLTYQGTPIGSLNARVRYKDEALLIEEATLEPEPEASARCSGRIDFRGDGALSIEGTATSFPLAPVLAVTGLQAPIAGRVSGTIALAGRPEAPTGRAGIEIAPVTIAGLEFDSMKGDLVFTGELLEARPVTIARGAGSLTLEGRLPFRGAGWVPEEGTGPPRLTVRGSGIDLSALSTLLPALPLQGTASVDGSVEGTLAEPHGSISLKVEALNVHGLLLGDVSARADLSGAAADIVLDVPDRGGKVTGRIGLHEGGPADLHLALADARFRGGTLVNGSAEDVQVILGGEARIQGRLADPTSLQAKATLDRFEASVAGVRVKPESPIELALESGRMRLAPVVLTGTGTRIEARGEIDPGAAGTIDLSASGRFDLKLARLFLKNTQATGEGSIVLHVAGPLAAPTFDGRLVLEAGAVRHPDLPFPIDGLLGKAEFEGTRLRIESLDFHAGGGPVTGTGEFRFGDLSRSESPFVVSSAEVHFQGSSVKGEFPEGFRSVSDMDLTVRREDGRTTLAGTIDLVRGMYVKDFKLESMGRTRSADVFRTPPSGVFAGIALDLTLRAPQDVWLRNDFGKVEGQGELRVRGTTDSPSIAGRITAVEGGTIRFRQVDYRVLGGTMDFSDPQVINPSFDLQAETRVSTYDVNLHVEGTVDDFHYDMTSTPPLPEQDIVALLLTGRTPGPVGSEPGALAGETVIGGLTGELTGRVAGRAGFDVLNIDPLQVNAQGDPTTRITVGKQVTPDLFVAYSSDLGSTQGSVYQLDYALERDFHFTSLRDRDGSIGGDFNYILRGRPPLIPGGPGAPASPPVVRSLKIEGELHFREGKVRRKLRVREGKPRNRSALNDGVDRLLRLYHRRGFLTADVDVHETTAPQGRVDLLVHVRSGPRVRIDVEGARGRGALREEVRPYWEKGLFLEDIVDEARDHLVDVYKDRACLQVSIDAEVLHEDTEEVRVRFTVKRGPRARAVEVRLAGVDRFSEKDARKVLQTRRDGAFSRGLVRQATLRLDAAALGALYQSRGFPKVAVDEPRADLDSTGRRAIVTFTVREGPLVTFGAPRFEGNHAVSAGDLAKAARIAPGSPYTTAAVEAALIALRRRYDDAGYWDARVTCRPPVVQDEAATHVEDPVFEIQEGRPQRVRDIHVAGNVLTHEKVIRKALTIDPGSALSRSDLLASQTRLYGRGVFGSVSVEPEAPDAGEPQEGVARRDVLVSVREAAPITQVFGVGYASDEKLRGQYEISDRNIFGSGRYVGLQTRASDLQQRATLSYREKGLFGGSYDLLGSAFGENEVHPGFDVRTIGSSIQLGRRFTRATRTLYRYTLKDVNLSDTTASFEGTTIRLSGLASSAIHDTRDAPFDPTRGHYLSGEVQYYAGAIGSQADFVKTFAQVYRFKQVFPRTIWAQALRAGAAIPFGVSKTGPSLTCAEGTITDSGVPPSERFFSGGDTTLRGFARDRVGATCNGDPLGGEGLFLLNEELRFPIVHALGGVLFYDLGNVYRLLDDYDLGDLRQVAGAGLRFATPIGPFRLEYGALLDRKEGDPRGELFFSIGQAF